MTDFPLTPAEALAVAAILEAHKRLPPSWQHVADRLRTWARTQTAATEEGEMPSQDRFPGSADGTIRGVDEAVPQGAETPGGTSPLHLDRSNREDKRL